MNSWSARILRYAASIALIAAIVAFYYTLVPVNATTVALSLLLAVLFLSTVWGLGEATAASIAAVLGFNYFFLPPVGTLTIQDPQNWVALITFLGTAITVSQLSARARRRAAEAEARRLDIERLYKLVQSMMLSGSPRKTIMEFVQQVVGVFGLDAAAFFYRADNEIFRSGPESTPLTDDELRTAAEVDGISMDAVRHIASAAVRLGGRSLGSMMLLGKLPAEQAVRAIANLVAITIEKARALEEASRADSARQGEALKSALLDSLAHDIRTPLTSIKAAATSLLGAAEPPQRELLSIIDEETDRLNLLAAEVIAMARIEAGKLHLDRRPVSIQEIVSTAIAELSAGAGRIHVTLPSSLPLAAADPEFAGQVVRQLLENALKYSPPDSPVAVKAELRHGKIVIGVFDHGPGIEENERVRIFDKFFRGRQHRFETPGTGMGLAIAKGIVEAHGGRIWVDSEPRQGSAFYFTLPAIPERAPEESLA
jgi:two-component system sensor histidine kinase KdpD